MPTNTLESPRESLTICATEPVIYTKLDIYPMTVQLNNIVNSVLGVKEYNVNMAAKLPTGLVPLFIYFVSGKLFVRGIAEGAVKG